MSFLESEIRKAWYRSGGKCECTRSKQNCHRGYRCKQDLDWDQRGNDTDRGWEAHRKELSKPNVASNCEILCYGCYKATCTHGLA